MELVSPGCGAEIDDREGNTPLHHVDGQFLNIAQSLAAGALDRLTDQGAGSDELKTYVARCFDHFFRRSVFVNFDVNAGNMNLYMLLGKRRRAQGQRKERRG